MFLMVIEKILSLTSFVKEWTPKGLRTSDFFFWLIFLVSSPPLFTTLIFPHSSSVNTSLVKSSKFPISSKSGSSSTIATFFEGLLYSIEL